VDLLIAIAAQETGGIWAPLRKKLGVDALLEICVGDVLDADAGRAAFPRTRAALEAVASGPEMFRVAREALVSMAAHVPGYAASAKKPNKFCRGFGIFQYDLQFFIEDPDYFLERRWRRFPATLGKCLGELHAAARRIGLGGRESLSDLEQTAVAIAYNTGRFNPKKGLQQGFKPKDGPFYGEAVFALLRLSQTIDTAPAPATVAATPPGTAPLPPPTPVSADGAVYRVSVDTAQLRLRREPVIDPDKPSANVIAHLPDGHRVRWISGKPTARFLEVETSLNGAHLRGFAASKHLVKVAARGEIPVVAPSPTLPAVSGASSITWPWIGPAICATSRAAARRSATSTRTTSARWPVSIYLACGGCRTRSRHWPAARRWRRGWGPPSASSAPTTCSAGCSPSVPGSAGVRPERSRSCRPRPTWARSRWCSRGARRMASPAT
jgi:hypothetical protein